ncbi:MAG: glycosyl transferase family 1 [Blastopirellula sp.]|nr:MAG: glycosyl transferase family 1 [Blastopirellula sp.]
MKILLCHNFYQQPGGEDQVFEDEASLLESHGHEVIRYTLHNDAIKSIGKIGLLKKTLWNSESAADLRTIVSDSKPDVMHCANVFPLISPAAYYVAKQAGVAVVQTLHNYRTICPNAQLLRDGKVCESCLGKSVAWPAIVNSCYRDSRVATAVVVAMQTFHRAKRTWTQQVDRYIALTEFSKQKHIEGGIPASKIDVKPNFVNPDPGIGTGDGDYAVFVGRISEEKGITTLLDAWSKLDQNLNLKIVGDGPLADTVAQAAQTDSRIEWVGRKSFSEVCDLVGSAQCLVMPSIWYETFGRTIIEAYAKGTPVIASRLGAMQELVIEGQTGLLFEPGNSQDLVQQIQTLFANKADLPVYRAQARKQYESHYLPETNYHQLMAIYQKAVAETDSSTMGNLLGAAL